MDSSIHTDSIEEYRSPAGRELPRRTLLASSAAGLAALAGCLGSDDDDDDGEPANGADDGDDGGNGADGGDSDDPNGADDGGDDGDEPPVPDGEASLSMLLVDGRDSFAELDEGTDVPVTVTLANEGEGEDSFDVTLSIGESVEETQTVDVEAGAETEVTFTGVTSGLAGGDHTVVVTTDGDQLSTDVTVLGDVELTLTVYTQGADEEYLVEAGELTVFAGSDVVATADLGESPTQTVTVPLAEADTFTVEVTNVDGGVFPNVEESVAMDGGPREVDIVAGYEFQGTTTFNFSTYVFEESHTDEDGTEWGNEEWVAYGTYAENRDYHSRYIVGSIGDISQRLVNLEDSPPPFEADLFEVGDELGASGPHHSVLVGAEGFFYPETRGRWEEGGNPAFRLRDSHTPVRNGLDEITKLDPDKQQYAGTRVVHGEEADVYELDVEIGGTNYVDAKVAVDPETGYIVRWQSERLNNEMTSSYEIVEFQDHNGPQELDWDRIRGYTGTTTDDDIDTLPWDV